jgi:hypothetical protein
MTGLTPYRGTDLEYLKSTSQGSNLTDHERVMTLLSEAASAQRALRAMNEDLLRAVVAGSDDAGPLRVRVDSQHERLMEITQHLLEALRTE